MTNLIRQLIFEHITEMSFGKVNHLYKIFTAKVLSKKYRNVSVLSFNFDFLLCEDSYNDVYFDYLLEFDWIDENRKEIYKNGNPISLIKLNGSLDWGICQSCNRLHLYYPQMGRSFYNDKICAFCKQKVEPFIIIPHEDHKKRMETLWTSAHDNIASTKKIVIIGYSFPHYDTKVIKLFSSSINKDTQIEVVDLCPDEVSQDRFIKELKEKYKLLFPNMNNNIIVHTSGFKGYLEDRLSIDIT